MKIVIETNLTEHSQLVAKQLQQKCQEYAIEIDSRNPEVVISIGGDGTLLNAFHQHKQQLSQVSFVAIHTGNLGFYTDFLADQIDDLLKKLIQKDQSTYSYPVLQVEFVKKDGTRHRHLALNEFTLKTLSGTLVCEVYIKGDLFEVFRGDGLCISTPTGSTGISKSLGGAVLHPCLDAMQLVEIAPLNNRVYKTIGSPLILPKEHTITLKMKCVSPVLTTIDNLDPELLDSSTVDGITLSLSTERVVFKNYKDINFWSRVEKSFIGEIEKEALLPLTRKHQHKIIKSEK